MEIARRITKKLTLSFLFASVAHEFQGVCIWSHSASDMTLIFFSFFVRIRINGANLKS